MTEFQQGLYTPNNPEKYNGNLKRIVYRSSWELYVCKFLDNNPNVLEWSSEEIAIPYIKPTDKKVHRYFVDFYVKYKDKSGQIKEELWEIKPKSQVKQPSTRGKHRRTQIHESLTYAVNLSKWQSATAFCKARNWTFKIMTEESLFK